MRSLTPEQLAELERAVERCQRRIDRAGKWRPEKFHPEWGSWATEEEEASQ